MGSKACRRIKANKQTAHIPIIFMTGLSDTQHVLEGLNAGGVDYITKPIVIDELIARIRVHLSNARVARGARRALAAPGRFLFAVDMRGRFLWPSPKAETLLSAAFEARDIAR